MKRENLSEGANKEIDKVFNFAFVKKAIVILLLIFYSASTIGATINMHYCMNKFASWSLSNVKKEKCANCGMKNTGCCKDEKKEIKLTLDQQKAANNLINHHLGFKALSVNHYNFSASCIVDFNILDKQNLAYLHSPPLNLEKDKQAILSTFII